MERTIESIACELRDWLETAVFNLAEGESLITEKSQEMIATENFESVGTLEQLIGDRLWDTDINAGKDAPRRNALLEAIQKGAHPPLIEACERLKVCEACEGRGWILTNNLCSRCLACNRFSSDEDAVAAKEHYLSE